MKKNLLGWFAMATMLVGSGCSSDEVVNDYSPENAIQFGTYVGRGAESRASETTSANIDNFGVFAYYTKGGSLTTPTDAPNFMNNQRVEKITYDASDPLAYNTNWKYTPIKYWPNNADDKVTFFAYSPYASENRMTSGATVLPSFAISDGTDFLWASSLEKSKQSVNKNVSFTFEHVMSRVAFYVEAMVDKVNDDNEQDSETSNDEDDSTIEDDNIDNATEIVITKVTLSGNLATTGSVTWNNAGGTWQSILSPGTLSSKTHELLPANFKAGTYTSTKGNVKGQRVNDDIELLSNANSYLMLIPQTAEITIEVEYSVITTDGNLVSGYSKVDNTNSSVFDFTFEKGKAYNFCLHIGMTSVKLSATVNGWDTPTDWAVNVPINEN